MSLISIISYLLVFILGLGIGGAIMLYLVASSLQRRMSNHVLPEVVDQLRASQEYLASVPVKDDRVRSLLQRNQRVLAKYQAQVNGK